MDITTDSTMADLAELRALALTADNKAASGAEAAVAAREALEHAQYRVELAENAAQDWTEEAIQARHVYVEALAAAGLVETASGPMTPAEAAALAFAGEGELQPGDCEDCQTTGGCRCNEGNR